MTGEALLARAFLHETDHLNGKLYISHISALKRNLIKSKIKKLQKAGSGRSFLRHSAIRRSHLSALVSAGHNVQLVVSQPDRPSGRGQQLSLPA